jgi:hypothetical protein
MMLMAAAAATSATAATAATAARLLLQGFFNIQNRKRFI